MERVVQRPKALDPQMLERVRRDRVGGWGGALSGGGRKGSIAVRLRRDTQVPSRGVRTI